MYADCRSARAGHCADAEDAGAACAWCCRAARCRACVVVAAPSARSARRGAAGKRANRGNRRCDWMAAPAGAQLGRRCLRHRRRAGRGDRRGWPLPMHAPARVGASPGATSAAGAIAPIRRQRPSRPASPSRNPSRLSRIPPRRRRGRRDASYLWWCWGSSGRHLLDLSVGKRVGVRGRPALSRCADRVRRRDD